MKTIRFSNDTRLSWMAVGASALAVAATGCSSSSSSPAYGTPAYVSPGSGADASVDSGVASTPDAASTGNAQPDAGSAIAQKVTEALLVADTDAGGAASVDPDVVNAWGLAFNPSGPAWIADNGTGNLTIWKGQVLGLTVTVPPPAGAAGPAAPSGQIFNASAPAFDGDLFIVCTEDGTVSGWQPVDGGLPTAATLRVDNSAQNSVYKGLAIVPSTPPMLVVADFHNDKISLFDASYNPVTPAAGAWMDSSIPAGFAPFNVATIGNFVYVAYAVPNAMMHDDVAGAGHGAVSVFDTSGKLVKSLIPMGGPLNSPWAMVQAPQGWGALGGALLVGDFGDGRVNAFDPTSGAMIGALADTTGSPLVLQGLWGLAFGPVDNADAGIAKNTLYFTSGPHREMNGLFGSLSIAP